MTGGARRKGRGGHGTETDPATGWRRLKKPAETAQVRPLEETVPETIAPTTKLKRRRRNRRRRANHSTNGEVAQISYPDRKERLPLVLPVCCLGAESVPGRGRRGGRVSEPADYPTRLRTQVVYEEVYPGWTSSMSCTATTSRETILRRSSVQRLRLSFRLNLQGLPGAAGGWLCRLKQGKPREGIPDSGPHMMDGTGRLFRGSVEYRLGPRKRREAGILTVTADRPGWRRRTGFTQAIDPTLT